ncbi:MAG: transcription termination/antitermination protein NusG [Spirochaetota bacterium]|nr:transcription termination/antitermination protein NusG [Spirochaetota bacterium]
MANKRTKNGKEKIVWKMVLRMAKSWYILHIYSGYENKVSAYIEKNVKKKEVGQFIGEIKVPTENIVEMHNGKKRQVKKKFFPGYILVEMDLPSPQEEWKAVCSAITQIQGVTGFVGAGKNQKPAPISTEEAKDILQRMGEIKSPETHVHRVTFSLGESIKVVDGPFTNFNGVVEDINYEKGKVKVRVEIFGRSTPVELDFFQVESL